MSGVALDRHDGERRRPAQSTPAAARPRLALGGLLVVLCDQPGALPWAVTIRRRHRHPRDWIGAHDAWLKTNFSWLTRSVTAVLAVPLDFALKLLAKGSRSVGAE